MADNIPTTIIKNIPPFVTVSRGNNGESFILPDGIIAYSDTFLAIELPDEIPSEPIKQETDDNILI